MSGDCRGQIVPAAVTTGKRTRSRCGRPTMTTSEPSPRQARQALRWVIRCSAGPLPERQQRTLQRWLQADPRHALAWRQQQAFWLRLDAAGPEVLAALPELTTDRQGLRPIAPRRRLPWRLATAAAVVLMVAAAPTHCCSRAATCAAALRRAWCSWTTAARRCSMPAPRWHSRSMARSGACAAARAGVVPGRARAAAVPGRSRRWPDPRYRYGVQRVDAGRHDHHRSQRWHRRCAPGRCVQRLRAGQARAFRDGRWLQPLRQAAPETMAPWRRGEVVIDDLPLRRPSPTSAATAVPRSGCWAARAPACGSVACSIFSSRTRPSTPWSRRRTARAALPGGALLVW